MNKAYSTKALPPGTVLREWRLEEVLGVGGFGIVYKGRGIYFNELVAIKEYFPSSISERDAEATVVPIDSNAEEVHALGLKKFVEEAKLLWNLSTPSRHPNIVSVRSLFEIHGTAYMVMDFEDGMSLSRLLKQGQRWNERSLIELIKPIAEGLDRAHRVGVLHRDIKPPNILINDSGRSVLIDFGSARFDTAEATSTTVTFHTPPYAAIEQYVKTFEQGPWTDIYALGVVLYECVTGTKPAEVLERMHGSAGDKLSDGEWPGYSKRFLAAIDAAMQVRPADRPQSIPEWLAMLDGTEPVAGVPEPEEDVTRIMPFDTASETIVPLAPPKAGFVPATPADTGVPEKPEDAHFKRAGQTGATKRVALADGAAGAAEKKEESAAATPVAEPTPASRKSDKSVKAEKPPTAVADKKPASRGLSTPILAGAAALAVLSALAAGWTLLDRSPEDALAEPVAVADSSSAPVAVPVADLLSETRSLLEEARAASAPAGAVDGLAALETALAATAPDAAAGVQQQARTALVNFATALQREADARAGRIGREVPWASLTQPAPADQAPERQAATLSLRNGLEGLRAAVGRATSAPDAGQSLAATRQALASFRDFSTAALAVASLESGDRARQAELAAATTPIAAAPQPLPTVRAPAATAQPKAIAVAPAATAPTNGAAKGDTLSPATTREFQGIVSEGRDMARQVIRMGERARQGSTAAERQAFELLRANAQLARTYDSSLATLRDSFRGVTSDRQADPLIRQARQTRAYLVFLVRRSTEASR